MRSAQIQTYCFNPSLSCVLFSSYYYYACTVRLLVYTSPTVDAAVAAVLISFQRASLEIFGNTSIRWSDASGVSIMLHSILTKNLLHD